MKEIIFVTSNIGKLKSAQSHLQGDVKLSHFNMDITEPDINDIDFIAEYKVKEAYKKVQKPCISLDAGFYIPNYPNNPNFPGAYPRREILEKFGISGLLKNMKNITDRECYFKECLAFYDGKVLKKFYGYNYGTLATEIRGNDSDKKWSDLWYVFIPKNCDKTMAEMTDEERKNRKDEHTSPFDQFDEWLQGYEGIKTLLGKNKEN